MHAIEGNVRRRSFVETYLKIRAATEWRACNGPTLSAHPPYGFAGNDARRAGGRASSCTDTPAKFRSSTKARAHSATSD